MPQQVLPAEVWIERARGGSEIPPIARDAAPPERTDPRAVAIWRIETAGLADRSIDVLVAVVADRDVDDEVRVQALQALQRTTDPTAIDTLVRNLTSARIGKTAARSLAACDAAVVDRIPLRTDGEWALPHAVANISWVFGKHAHHTNDAHVRWLTAALSGGAGAEAAWALSEIGTRAVRSLLAAAPTMPDVARRRALAALATMADIARVDDVDAVVTFAIGTAASDDAASRELALQLLGELPTARARAHVIASATSAARASDRSAALLALQNACDDPIAVGTLRRATASPYRTVRIAALCAIHEWPRFPDDAALAARVDALIDDPDDEIAFLAGSVAHKFDGASGLSYRRRR